MIRDII
jgi:hypothetical protein